MIYSATWLALTIVLSAIGLGYTWFAFGRHGITGLLRGTAWTLLPIAAYLTRTLRLVGTVIDQTIAWATGFVFSPASWLGIALAGVSVVLFGVSRRLPGRERGQDRAKAVRAVETESPGPGLPSRKQATSERLVDDEIDEILRRHGIS